MTGTFTLALHALVYLNHKKTFISSHELAQNICTDSARVRRVMKQLKKAGLIVTREGRSGGYKFVRDAGKLTLYDIAEAVGAEFVAASYISGSADMDCLISSGMAGIIKELCGDMNSACCRYLKSLTVADIDKKIFSETA